MTTSSPVDHHPATGARVLVALSAVTWVAAAVHHLDDVLADDYLGSPANLAVRTITLLALHIIATRWAARGRRAGLLLLGAISLWWFVTVFVGHAAAVTRSIPDIATSEPRALAPLWLAAVVVGGISAFATAVTCAARLRPPAPDRWGPDSRRQPTRQAHDEGWSIPGTV